MVYSKTETEEIADRAFHTRIQFAIPVCAQNDALQVIRLRVRNRKPDMRNLARPVCFEHSQPFTRANNAEVVICPSGIGAGSTMRNVGLLLREIGLPSRRLAKCCGTCC